MNKLICLFLATFSLAANAGYSEKKDDFSTGKILSFDLTSTNNKAKLFIGCYPKKKISVQIATTDTIFPDDTVDSGMVANVTFKFDSFDDVNTSKWFMALMKYDRAWFVGDTLDFTKKAVKANQLNVRFNKRNDVYKFKLVGTAKHLPKLIKACGNNTQT